MNFKTDNDYYSDKTIFETDDSDIQLEYNIFHKNNASFVIIQSNLWEWPITLMIDTGAAISIIAEDKINERIKIKNKTINLFGIAGRDKSIKTRGEVTAIFEVGDSKLSSSMHIVDKRYSGPASGYLGFDFLKTYKAIIDLKQMKLILRIPNEKIKENNKYFAILPFYEYNFEKEENTIESTKMIICETPEIIYESMEIRNSNEQKAQNQNKKEHERIYNKLKLDNTEDESQTVRKLCKEFPFQFYIDRDNLGCTDVMKQHIILKPDAKIVNIRQYITPQACKKIPKEFVEKYERQGIIGKCQSPYNSRTFIILWKIEGDKKMEYRFVVDYKKQYYDRDKSD